MSRDDDRFGYFPPGETPTGLKGPSKRGGADLFGFIPDPNAPRPEPASFEDVPVGVCPFCAKDFRDKPSPLASLASHVRGMKDDVHRL